MASVTATAKPEREARPRRLTAPGSRLGRLIVTLNLVGLAILIGGALLLNELRQGLVNARIASLRTQGQLIANVIDDAATIGDPEPALEADRASEILQSLFIPKSQRARLFDAEGKLIADSYVVADRVERYPLPPARRPGERPFVIPGFAPKPRAFDAAQRALSSEVRRALAGAPVADVRVAEGGERVVSISIPIERVRAVLGVLTLEANDVDQIIAAERAAMIPFIITAVAVNLISSFALTQLIAQPVRRLSRAADSVRLSRARAIDLPDLAARRDELGDLARSLEDMTHTLSERMAAIERFAADVAHEIRNPLTSIRSAVETLDLVSDPAARARLTGILKQDVGRLDRLITDISNASRLDAELARDSPRPVDLGRLLRDITAMYEISPGGGAAAVRLIGAGDADAVVPGREGPLGQVFRNLIDNARSFSPEGGEVRVYLWPGRDRITASVEDDGPGMPPENLETVFERFYTSRPKGKAFGGNSGLGLSIARQIVQAHGGEIRAENRVDGGGRVIGARFVVTLPAAGPRP
ncbi:MAG: sensor N-terminal transmembrane domain-containing protein [Caulobacteraceae bacterium]|nr:sensor N-terminal transmembrane domain-containing protein [Caulobacteraceae bacterium]